MGWAKVVATVVRSRHVAYAPFEYFAMVASMASFFDLYTVAW